MTAVSMARYGEPGERPTLVEVAESNEGFEFFVDLWKNFSESLFQV